MSVKIKVSYENEQELRKVLELLKVRENNCKPSKNQEGRYKKAYIFIK